ncbi:MAG: hypothetical protein LAT75_01275 [Candidatus Cyclonatronum sp.]|uniref:hypothetical protein n=1 Tax=Cyclonatronum sp. TaxID=3024185 RepID=UPI0025C004D2|nr:hypothetical protein [Cyclonatronum sp.]MCC5934535.1 hypothetical protein [Balneolales bacterium]MCH8485464.1 hypothetical protein [Cyclonatronum sp.]
MYLNSPEELRETLTYHDEEHDQFWFGEGQIFELFFVAADEGPSAAQLSYYLNFQNNSVAFMDRVREKVIDAWEREKGKAPARFYEELPIVDIITINPEGSNSDMDMVLSFRTFKFLFYSRWTTYVARFKGDRLTLLQTARSFDAEENTASGY